MTDEIIIGNYALKVTPLMNDVTIRHNKDRQLIVYVCRNGCHSGEQTMEIAREIVGMLISREKK